MPAMRDTVRGLGDTIRRRWFPGPAAEGQPFDPGSEPRMTSDLLQAGGGRFPTLTHGAVPVNPYKPLVLPVDFPKVQVPFNPNIPPSISPQMIIRTGTTPNPVGIGHAFVGQTPHTGPGTGGMPGTTKRKVRDIGGK